MGEREKCDTRTWPRSPRPSALFATVQPTLRSEAPNRSASTRNPPPMPPFPRRQRPVGSGDIHARARTLRQRRPRGSRPRRHPSRCGLGVPAHHVQRAACPVLRTFSGLTAHLLPTYVVRGVDACQPTTAGVLAGTCEWPSAVPRPPRGLGARAWAGRAPVLIPAVGPVGGPPRAARSSTLPLASLLGLTGPVRRGAA